MAEIGPEIPRANFGIPPQEPSGPTAEVSIHRLRKALALGGAVVASMLPAPTFAQTANEQPEAPLPVCGWNLLQGPEVNCVPEQAPLPVGCASEQALIQLGAYKHDEGNRRLGARIVRNFAETSSAPEAPHMALGIEDDGAVTYNNQGRAEAVLALGRMMGATHKRMVVYPYRFMDPHFRKEGYDKAADLIKACGYDLQATLSCDKTNWTPKKFKRYITEAAEFFKRRAQSLAICNEPNYPGWLRPMKGKTLAETYAKLYDIGYRVIKKANPKTNVIFGDLSGLHSPMIFLKNVVKWNVARGKQLKMDLLGYHPYLWFRNTGKLPPLIDKKARPDSETLGVNALHVVERTLRKLFNSRRVATPMGAEPKIVIDEYANMASGEGRQKWRVIPEKLRAIWYTRILNKVCGNRRYGLFSFYMIDNPPPNHEDKSVWNSGMINKWRRLGTSYYTIQAWWRQNRDRCVAEEPAAVSELQK